MKKRKKRKPVVGDLFMFNGYKKYIMLTEGLHPTLFDTKNKKILKSGPPFDAFSSQNFYIIKSNIDIKTIRILYGAE